MKRQSILVLSLAATAAAIACARSEANAPPAISAETLAKGRATYMTTCAPCHGDKGKGDGPGSKIFKPPPRDHTDGKYMHTLTDEDLGKIIQIGGAVKGKPNMPSNPQIRGDELTALVAYVRTLSRDTHEEREK